jgi:hypothetical protein
MSKRNHLDEAIKNIEADRESANDLLVGIMEEISKSKDYRSLGPIAAKAIDSLQRSNAQLTSIALTLEKKNEENEEFSDNDRDGFFESVQNKDEDK